MYFEERETFYKVRAFAEARQWNVDVRLVCLVDEESNLAGQYRSIALNIHALQVDTNDKTILFTSALSGEGKSITASNVAIASASAEQKQKVLLLDADMRRPAVGKLFHVFGKRGLSEILQEDIDYKELLIEQMPNHLWILNSGNIPDNPVELLETQRFQELLKKLCYVFDLIIIDSPPVIPVSDARIIAPLVDGVVLVVKAKKTLQHDVERARDLILDMKAELRGGILSAVKCEV